MKKAIQIGFQSELETKYLNDIATKRKCFNNAYDYVQQFISIDPKTFAQGFKMSFLKAWEEQRKNEFPPIVPLEKQIEISGVELHKIDAWETKYNSIEIPVDPISGKAPKVDFGIYATTPEEQERYEKAKRVCEALKDFAELGNVNFGNVVMGLGGRIRYNFGTQELEPVKGWVKGERYF